MEENSKVETSKKSASKGLKSPIYKDKKTLGILKGKMPGNMPSEVVRRLTTASMKVSHFNTPEWHVSQDYWENLKSTLTHRFCPN